jgi:biopolymer transport protein ExbD
MLLTRQKRKPPSPKLNMTPMIDIIFQLLVFFMCTASFSVEDILRTQLPTQGQARKDGAEEQEDFPPTRVRVTRLPEGVHVTCDGKPCMNFGDLVGKLKARHGILRDKMRVIIEGEGAVPFGYMARALDACHEAELQNVALLPKGITR